MLRKVWLAVLLALVGGYAEAQSCDGCGISYKAPGGLATLTGTASTTTTTVPILFPDGTVAAPSIGFANDTNTGIYRQTGVVGVAVTADGNEIASFTTNGTDPRAFKLHNTAKLGWGSGSGAATNLDTILERDAANTLALRNATNAQTFNIYNTYTDGSNYERGGFKWTASQLQIVTEGAGTGSSFRQLVLNPGGTIIFGNTVLGSSDDARNIGSDAVKFQSGYFSRSIQGGKTKALTAGAATTVATVAVPQTAGSNFAAGQVFYTVYATDTTDTQTLNGRALFSAVNKAGTETCTIEDDQITDEAASTGTLACTIACAVGLTDVVGITLDCTSSLTETTLNALVRFDMQQPNTLAFP